MTTEAPVLPFFYFPELSSLTPSLNNCQQNKTLVNNKTSHSKVFLPVESLNLLLNDLYLHLKLFIKIFLPKACCILLGRSFDFSIFLHFQQFYHSDDFL